MKSDQTQAIERLMYLVAVIRENDLLDNPAVDSIVYDEAKCSLEALDHDLEIALDELSNATGIEIPPVEDPDDFEDDDYDYNDEEEDDDA